MHDELGRDLWRHLSSRCTALIPQACWCAGHKCCPCTGMPLGSYICVRSFQELRERICDWAALRGISLDALFTLRNDMQSGGAPPQIPWLRHRRSAAAAAPYIPPT